MIKQKLGLGTVQFGLDYGISNGRGRVSEEQVGRILALAASQGVTILDTASGYGDSEGVLGRAMPMGGQTFRIVTKLPVVIGNLVMPEDAQRVSMGLNASLQRLGLPSVYGLLAHHATDILKPDGRLLIRAMEKCRDVGWTRKIGVSVYHADEIDRILDLFTPDIVQLPISVADQRLLHSGHLDRLKNLGVEIHARSIFLQGLLLMAPEVLPDFFSPVRDHFSKIRAAFVEQGWSALEGCLRFAMERPELDVVLTGVAGVDELEEILAITTRCDGKDHGVNFPAVPDVYEDHLNPARWKIAQ
ncbi:MAG: aldo/keto reductase [Nitrospirae bacterium]|nr:aldo/keto reductase [Magnetococcales bacterium]